MCSKCSRFHRNRFNFGGVTSERENTARARSKVNPSSRIIRMIVYEQLECGPMPNVMVALPNICGALCSTPQSNAAKMRKPLKFAGVPQTRQRISAVRRPKFTIIMRTCGRGIVVMTVLCNRGPLYFCPVVSFYLCSIFLFFLV